jgi:hypothetical protein
MSIETLRPNAAGDETNIANQYPSSGEHWDKVDEETPDESNTHVNTNSTSYQRDLYNLPAHSVGSGTINFIKIYFRFKLFSTGTGYAKPSLKSNSTVTDGTEVEHTSGTWTTYSEQWNTNPADSQPWEWADIDALQIGVSLKKGTMNIYCTQVYVEIDYGAAGTEKTSSDSGSGVDAYVSLVQSEAKTSSDTGSGVEGTPLPSAILAGSETGSGSEALIARLLAALDTGTGAEVGGEVGGLPKDLFAIELGWGFDSLTAKIEMPTKGGGMKLWT